SDWSSDVCSSDLTDNWYEGDQSTLFRADSGTFTYLGGEMAPYSHGVGEGLSPDAPVLILDKFLGHASFIGGTMVLRRASNGIEVRSAPAGTYAMFFGMTPTL